MQWHSCTPLSEYTGTQEPLKTFLKLPKQVRIPPPFPSVLRGTCPPLCFPSPTSCSCCSCFLHSPGAGELLSQELQILLPTPVWLNRGWDQKLQDTRESSRSEQGKTGHASWLKREGGGILSCFGVF